MLSGYSFRPRVWALALAAAACAAGIALGQWQAGRADQKRRLGAQLEQALRAPPVEIPAARIDPSAYVMKHVAARGRFVNEKNASYALQWYSLAGLAVVLVVVLSFRRVGAP